MESKETEYFAEILALKSCIRILREENAELTDVLDQVKCFLERNQEHIPESQDAEEIYFLIKDKLESGA